MKQENCTYYSGHVEKAEILEKLRENGCRITKQREALIDIILEEECTCCKEIYYMAVKRIPEIGIATIYRMVNSLEEIGAIRKENPYRVCCHKGRMPQGCMVELENSSTIELDLAALHKVIEKGMEACGYAERGRVSNIRLQYVSA